MPSGNGPSSLRVAVPLLACDAGRTLSKTMEKAPQGTVDGVVLGGDATQNKTTGIGRYFGMLTVIHTRHLRVAPTTSRVAERHWRPVQTLW